MILSMLIRISTPVFLIFTIFLSDSSAVRCYCTYQECGEAFCESDWCLVGFKKNDRGIIYQKCASETVANSLTPCKTDIQEWDEVCKCSQHSCNSYSFYRRAIETYFQGPDGGLKRLEKSLHGTKDNTQTGLFTNARMMIVLVCVPLALGFITAIFVFINYNCKL